MRRLFVIIIRLYQLTISSWLPPMCRFTPSCSQYAIIAINRHGIIKGVFLSIKRILRCNPWGGCGHDPVP